MVGFYRVFDMFLRLWHATGRAKCAGPPTLEDVRRTEPFLLLLLELKEVFGRARRTGDPLVERIAAVHVTEDRLSLT